MATNAVVRSRIDAEVKDKAAAVLGAMGLTVSDTIRIVLTRVANENALPFDLRPNKLTRLLCVRPRGAKKSTGRRTPPISTASWEFDAHAQLFNPIPARCETAPETRVVRINSELDSQDT